MYLAFSQASLVVFYRPTTADIGKRGWCCTLGIIRKVSCIHRQIQRRKIGGKSRVSSRHSLTVIVQLLSWSHTTKQYKKRVAFSKNDVYKKAWKYEKSALSVFVNVWLSVFVQFEFDLNKVLLKVKTGSIFMAITLLSL